MSHVCITGASGAIGTALALAYAKAGHSVSLLYCRNCEKAEALAEHIKSTYRTKAIAIGADLKSTDEVNAAMAKAKACFGMIEILINNAGIASQKLFCDITDADWEDMIETNLGGVFRCCRAVLPDMICAHRGSILNISSMWGQIGASCEVHYSAAKAGVIGLTRALAKEVGPSGITVNGIAPGVIESPMLASFTKEDLNVLRDETPLCRLGRGEDVAKAALALTDLDAPFITGQVLGVNGGFVM